MSSQTYNPTSKNYREPLLRNIDQTYDKLQAVADRKIANEKYRHDVEPSALVHDVCVQLLKGAPLTNDSEAYFLAVAKKKMARRLTDLSRSRKAIKNGGGMTRVSMDNADIPSYDYMESQIIFSEALTRLEAVNGDQAAVLELVTFQQLTLLEVAQALHMSLGMARKHWRGALAWFQREVYFDNDAA